MDSHVYLSIDSSGERLGTSCYSCMKILTVEFQQNISFLMGQMNVNMVRLYEYIFFKYKETMNMNDYLMLL